MHMLVFALQFERHAIPCTPCFPWGGGGGGIFVQIIGGARGGGGGGGGVDEESRHLPTPTN